MQEGKGERREGRKEIKAGDGEDRVRRETERVQGDRERRGEGRKGAGWGTERVSHDKAENGPRSAVRIGDRGRRRRVGVGRSEVKVRRLREEGAEGSREERRRGRSRREAGRSSEGPSEGPSDGRILAPWDRGTSAFVS